jgi:hypothetical protein
MKKFVKRIGKGIKKIGKAIGKPFKKLMKTKIGKIIGTIGMMMIGGWMMAGAKTFASSLWAGQGMGTAFSNGLGAMGNAAGASFTNITDGIKGMFGETTAAQKTTSEALAASTEAGTTNMSNKLIDQIAIDGKVPTSDITTQAMQTTQDRLLEAGTELPSGRVTGLTDDAFAKVMKKSPIGDMPMGLSTEQRLDFASSIAPEVQPTQYIAQKKGMFGLRTDDITMRPLVNDPVTGKAIIPDGFREVSDFGGGKKSLLDKAYDMPFEEIKEKTYGYQPFKDTNLPGVIREGTVGQGYALSQALATPEEPYVQGYSDMSGAYAALDANTARLQAAIPTIDELQDGRTSVPSPSVVGGAADYMNNTRKAGFVWDTSLLAVNPANFGQ